MTQAYLDRVAAYDKRGPLINSLISINLDALLEADRQDAALKATGKLTGPLHAIHVIVKDNIDVAGVPMTAGFSWMEELSSAAGRAVDQENPQNPRSRNSPS